MTAVQLVVLLVERSVLQLVDPLGLLDDSSAQRLVVR